MTDRERGTWGPLGPDSESCPLCGTNLRYGPKQEFSHVIAIYDSDSDRTVAWRCPECGHREKRR